MGSVSKFHPMWSSQYTRKYHYYHYVWTCVPRHSIYRKWPAGMFPAIVWSPECPSPLWVIVYGLQGSTQIFLWVTSLPCVGRIPGCFSLRPSGDTGGAVPFPFTPASWTGGSNCLHKSTSLTRLSHLPCSPETGEPAAGFFQSEAELHLHDQWMWQLCRQSPPSYTQISGSFQAGLLNMEKKQRKITDLWRFYQSPLMVHHFTVTPPLLFESQRSPSRECFLQSLWSREALEICWLTHGECEMTLHCLNHSQFKGTGTSSPAAATFHVGVH